MSAGRYAPEAIDAGGVAGDQLRSIVEQIERLEEEKKALQEDIKDVYAEAKGNGFDVKVLRKIIAMRKRDRAELDEEETILTLYLRALGMLPEDFEAAARGGDSEIDGQVERLFAGLVTAAKKGDVHARSVIEAARVGGADLMVATAQSILDNHG